MTTKTSVPCSEDVFLENKFVFLQTGLEHTHSYCARKLHRLQMLYFGHMDMSCDSLIKIVVLASIIARPPILKSFQTHH